MSDRHVPHQTFALMLRDALQGLAVFNGQGTGKADDTGVFCTLCFDIRKSTYPRSISRSAALVLSSSQQFVDSLTTFIPTTRTSIPTTSNDH